MLFKRFDVEQIEKITEVFMNRPDMMPADPDYRKKVLLILLLITLVGFLLLALAVPFVNQLFDQANPEQALQTLKLVLSVLILMPTLFSVYIIRIAIRTLRQQQFPPEGVKVMRDTPIVYDGKAKQRGIILLVLAGLIDNISIFAFVIILKLFETIQ